MTFDKNTLYQLKPNRMHEACGPSALTFAAAHMAMTQGPVFWVKEQWQPEQLNPIGLLDFTPPENLLTATTANQTETLAVAEETLRSGVSALVVLELSGPIDLTAGRRLQLAARAGNSIGLAIIPLDAGSNAAETRWHCRPVFDPKDSTLQRWKLIKNKSGTLGVWNVRWSTSTRRINVVPETSQ